MSIYIVLVLLFVLVLVIVTKISLSIAILFYALVCDDDDEDDAGLSSGAGTNLKVGGTCQARSARKKNFCRAPPFFGFTSTISRFGKRFRVLPFVKFGGRAPDHGHLTINMRLSMTMTRRR